MITTLLLAQVQPDELETAWRMVVEGTPSTKLILVILAVFSLGSWAVIMWKAVLFRRLRKLADSFHYEMKRSERLEEAYRNVLALPDSPFTRVFRSGVSFFSELRPGALSERGGTTGFSGGKTGPSTTASRFTGGVSTAIAVPARNTRSGTRDAGKSAAAPSSADSAAAIRTQEEKTKCRKE